MPRGIKHTGLEKTCCQCQQSYPIAEFTLSSGRILSYCRACERQRVVAWQRTHRKELALYNRRRKRLARRHDPVYQAQKRARWAERARQRYLASKPPPKPMPTGAQAAQLAYQDGAFNSRCGYCSAPAESHSQMTPGDESLANLVPCCRSCLSGKSNQTLLQWIVKKGYIGPGMWEV
jgi:hypothetical protein